MNEPEPSSLSERIDQLERRVAALERRLAEPRPQPQTHRTPATNIPPVLIHAAPPRPEPGRWLNRSDWEQLVGTRGALWLGAATLLVAAVSLLLIHWQELSAAVQFLLAAAVGIGLVVWGDRMLRTRRSPFGEAAGALGLGVLYADVLAAVRHGPVTVELALVMLAACVALGASMSARQRSQTLAVASVAGGYLAPWALGAVGSVYGSVLIPVYLSALAAAFGWLAMRRDWTVVWWSVLLGAWGAYAGCWADASRYDWGGGRFAALALPSWTVLVGLLAMVRLQRRVLSGPEAWLVAVAGIGLMSESYLLLQFTRWSAWWLAGSGLILLALERWCHAVHDDLRTGVLFIVALIAAALACASGGVAGLMVVGWAALGYLSVWIGCRRSLRVLSISGQVLWSWAVLYQLFQSAARGDVQGLIDVQGLAILSTAVSGALLARRCLLPVTGNGSAIYGAYAALGAVWWWNHTMRLLAEWQRSVGADAATAATSWIVYGDWIATAGAAVIGAVAVLTGLRHVNAGARFGGGLVLAVALMRLVESSQPYSNVWPLLSARGVMHLSVIGAFGFLSMVLRARDEGSDRGWSVALALMAWLAAAFALSIETRQAVHLAVRDASRADNLASLITSLVWCLLGAVMLIKGIHSQYRWLRVGALGWICITVLKVFGSDLAYLPDTMRMVSLFGLGLSLVGVSWLYARYVSDKR